MLLCRVRCVGILARSSCTISMQNFEVGEMYCILSVGQPVFFPTNCDFLSAVTTSRVTIQLQYLYFLEVSLSFNISERNQRFNVFGETKFKQGLRVNYGTTNRLPFSIF